MLQQTRVAQGIPYYHKFIENFPAVEDLAEASEDKVLKLWQGLGYYSRARNLHQTAKVIAYEYEGAFPDTYQELLKLKGIGDYTASAIASISFDRPEPVVDGNVYRVLARYFGVDLPINSSGGIKYFKELAREVMDRKNIRDYNQGLMEFGALQCAPKKPYCLHCPLNTSCVALQQNKIDRFPVKLKKAKIKNRFFNYLVLLDPENKTLLRQRTGKGIWQNLFEFPLLETSYEIDKTELLKQLPPDGIYQNCLNITQANAKTIVHKLSHQHLHTRFWILKIPENLRDGIDPEDLESYAVPVLIADFIKTLKNSYF